MKCHIGIMLIFLFQGHLASPQHRIYVSNTGSDTYDGSFLKPFKTIQQSLNAALGRRNEAVVIEIRGGKYYLQNTLTIYSQEYKCRSLRIQAYKNEMVIISGSKIRPLKWSYWKNHIWKTKFHLSEKPDRLYFNGLPMPMARYPDVDTSVAVFNGTAADAISTERISRWKNPNGAYIHALHNYKWGSLHFRIIQKSLKEELKYEGGWQNNRPSPMHSQYRFVENVFEELDAPGEWFYDLSSQYLCFFPANGKNPGTAIIETGTLKSLLAIRGDEQNPVRNIVVSNIHFVQTDRTFMLTKEPLLRSDWTIYRGGAVLLNGTENVTISGCSFHELGGNGVFISNYNRNANIINGHFYNIGASAIAFVGNPSAVRSPSFSYNQFVNWEEMDYAPGPKNNDYPEDCAARGNLIYNIGQIEKQSAGVQIEMASGIVVSHNSIYNTPRAGINIGDGCWGGHLIEFNDVFNTVLETGDHGAFNSWGRDRFWRPERSIIDSIVVAKPGIELLDAMKPIRIDNNRFQCDHGWDIDLDDGSSNYVITNNICLSGGLKLREGYHRRVINNIIVNNTFHPHVWQKNSDDVFIHNMVTFPYEPILMDYWGAKIDSNYFLSEAALKKVQEFKLDQGSVAGNFLVLDDVKNIYRLREPLLAGFAEIRQDFGVTDSTLKRMAKQPRQQALIIQKAFKESLQIDWLGGIFKNVETPGEQSAAGLPDISGVLLIAIPKGSLAEKNGLRIGDVVRSLSDRRTHNVIDLQNAYQSIKWMGSADCLIYRNQALVKTTLYFSSSY